MVSTSLMRRETKLGSRRASLAPRLLRFSSLGLEWLLLPLVILFLWLLSIVLGLIPVIVTVLEKNSYFKARPQLFGPLQTVLCGIILSVSTPLGCALFPQVGLNLLYL